MTIINYLIQKVFREKNNLKVDTIIENELKKIITFLFILQIQKKPLVIDSLMKITYNWVVLTGHFCTRKTPNHILLIALGVSHINFNSTNYRNQ